MKYFLGILLLLIGSLGWAQQQASSLKDTAQLFRETRSDNDTIRSKANLKLAQLFIPINPKRALQYNDLQLKEAKLSGNESFLSASQVYFLVIRQNLKQPFNPDELKKCIVEAKRHKRFLSVFKAYDVLTNYYVGLLEHDKALAMRVDQYKVAQQANDLELQAIALHGMTFIYNLKGLVEKALENEIAVAEIHEKTGNVKGLVITNTSLGVLYEGLKQYEKAYLYQKKALKDVNQLNDNRFSAIVNLNVGVCLGNLKRFREATTHLLSSLKYATEAKDTAGISNVYVQLCAFATETKDFHQAIEYGLNAQKIAKSFKAGMPYYRDACYYLRDGYAGIGDYKTGLKYYSRFVELKDSLMNIENNQKIIEAQTQFQTEKVSNQNKLLAEQNKRNAMQIEKDRFARYFLLAGLSSLGLLAGFIFYQYRNRIKAGKILMQHNSEIEGKNQALTSAYDEINHKNFELTNAYEELNTTLEQVNDQSKQIQEKNAALTNAYEELNAILEHVNTQKLVIQEKNLKIEDSIHYASRIQRSILPEPELVSSLFPKHFIYYQPKDVVSGDFYWIYQNDDSIFLAVVDCTGHGVPGAFMSVVGYSLLNQIVKDTNCINPADFLHELDRRVIATLKQDQNKASLDGMDIILAIFPKQEQTVKIASAGRSFYHYRNEILTEHKGDRFPIGGVQFENKSFQTLTIDIQAGDRLYLFSDGITDQFGGTPPKKFTHKRLQNFIIKHQNISMQEQSSSFSSEMANWMVNRPQLDDLTLVGIEM